MSDNVTINIADNPTVDRRVNFEWPKQDTRVPESQRKKVQLSGFADCEFVYFSQDDLDEQDAMIADGELTVSERFRLLVPVINGFPTNGKSAHDFIDAHKYGVIIRNAIMAEYFENMSEARRGNSGKRRSR